MSLRKTSVEINGPWEQGRLADPPVGRAPSPPSGALPGVAEKRLSAFGKAGCLPSEGPPHLRRPVRTLTLATVFVAFVALPAPGLELAPCKLEAVGGRQEMSARCGELLVPLDPSQPEGERIGLHVAVVPALAEDSLPDPLVITAGGPGDAATRFYVSVAWAFASVARRRDIVLVDQRGTGKSAPLHCPGLDAEGLDWGVGESVDETVTVTLECLDDLDHDPRLFTTSVAVGDLELVREALGYEELNIYGVSYGTRVAQHYLRRHPDRVRSLALDGLVPASVSLGPDTAIESQAALDATWARCEADASCNVAFPDIRARFETVMQRLGEAPAEITVPHPSSGKPTPLTLSRTIAAGVVRLLVYSPHSAAMLPVLFNDAFEHRYERLAAQALMLAAGVGELAYGLNFAVVCTEDVPFWDEVDLDAQRATYMGTMFVEALAKVCERWPAGVMDEDFKAPVESDAPVLILTGEKDPITPARYVPLATPGLANHIEVIGPGQGHGMLGTGCVPRLMAEFVDTAEPAELDVSCVERIAPFPPFISPLGPAP